MQAALHEETADTLSNFLAVSARFSWFFYIDSELPLRHKKVDKDILNKLKPQSVDWLWIRFEVLAMLLFQIEKQEPKTYCTPNFVAY